MCNHVAGKASAHAIANRISLTSTSHNIIQDADPAEIGKSASLLRHIVKASAFCLEHKDGPDGAAAAALWRKFPIELETTRLSHAALMHPRPQDNLNGKILMPMPVAERPEGKIAAKIDLARMTPPGENVIAAYPDPLLLVYRSSIICTRYQMMAEAEPVDIPGDYPGDIFISSDQVSKTSEFSRLY
mmetsp:Transcript_13293/g.25192  ORF Transcript_13293/g.25192 Transcript_13293/m.25192 type:complete len:187 (+) Transcript_13293:905-1465(+)